MVYSSLSAPELLMMPLAFLVAGALSLFTFNNALKFIGSAASKSFAAGGGIQKTIQPYAAAIKPVVDNIFGGSSFQVKLEHILLAAIVIVLIGIWRSVHINGQHLAEIAAAGKKEEPKKKGAAAAAPEPAAH